MVCFSVIKKNNPVNKIRTEVKKNKVPPKEPWLVQGLKLLEEEGPGAISIDRLAALVGKSKGSFYFHFKSRNGYIEQLLAHYKTVSTANIQEKIDQDLPQWDKLKKLTELIFNISSKQELAIRAWALYDPLAKTFQDDIDQIRLAFIQDIYAETAKSPGDARLTAHKNYALYIGLQQIKHLHTEETFKVLLKSIFLPEDKPQTETERKGDL